MTKEEKELAIYCLKANSDHHSEVCEECVKYPNCDHTIQDDVTETIIKALEQEPKTEHWIPVSERLPKPFRYVNCTCHSLIDDREDWVVETLYLPQPSNSPYSDWGNIPMLNHCKCEVTAWMYRDIPEPYVPDTNIGKMSEISTDSGEYSYKYL